MINRVNLQREQAIEAILKTFHDYLPPQISGLPPPSASIANMSERPVGLSNHISTEKRGAFPVVAVKGLRLDALVRLQVWALNPDQLNTDFTNINSHLMADRDSLRTEGFLRLTLENTQTADRVVFLNAWHQQADYRILYEYQFQDSDDAESLITRIQIDANQEATGLPQSETTTITDQIIRWDNQNAPALNLRGSFTIGALSALVFISNVGPTETITLTRTVDGLTGPPTSYSTWNAFLAAVAGPNPQDRHAQITFPSLQSFLGQFTEVDNPTVVGASAGLTVLESYRALVLTINPTIQLLSVFDRLDITYQHQAFDQAAVLYLRATGG